MTQHTPPQGGTKPARSAASTAILVTTSVVGGLALIGAAASAAFGLRVPEPWEVVDSDYVIEESGGSSSTEYLEDGRIETELFADAAGVTSIEINAAASDFKLEYGDVEEAVLSVNAFEPNDSTLSNGWTLERDGDELIVDRELGREGSSPSDDNCMFGCGPRLTGDQKVTLTLPYELGEERTASLDVQVSAGSFTGTGSFDELTLEVKAGDITFEGDARTLDIDVVVGDSTVEVSDVEDADISVTTGDSSVVLTGEAPANVELSAQMGELTVELPQTAYRVDTSGMAGEIDNRLEVSKDSKHLVEVEAKAAEVVLKH